MTRPNPAKVMKATVPKDALMKGTHLNRPSYDILANEKSICNFYKNCYIKYDRKKKHRKYYIYSLGSKYIWSLLHREINKNY